MLLFINFYGDLHYHACVIDYVDFRFSMAAQNLKVPVIKLQVFPKMYTKETYFIGLFHVMHGLFHHHYRKEFRTSVKRSVI